MEMEINSQHKVKNQAQKHTLQKQPLGEKTNIFTLLADFL